MLKNFLDKTKLLFSIYYKNIKEASNLLYKHEKSIAIIAMLGFAILTIIGVAYHEPWFDEAQAWLIAKNNGPIELLQYLKYEGHPFFWYLILMPFAKLNIPYPLPMQILNILIMWATVYLLWKKAPLNPLLKLFVTFSLPIAYQYTIIARCYSGSVFFLFLLTALFKDKLKHPYCYAIIILLCANTSAMALLGAALFGGLFIFDYIKENPKFYKLKEFYILCLIAALCVGLLGYQLLGSYVQAGVLSDMNIGLKFSNPIYFITYLINNGLTLHIYPQIALNIVFVIVYIILCIVTFWQDKRTLFFYLGSLISIAVFLYSFYSGFAWHHLFIYVYFVLSLWLYKSNENIKNPFYYFLTIFFILISARLVFITYVDYHSDIKTVMSNSKEVAIKIANDENIRRGNIVICDEMSHSVVPYLSDLGIETYECVNKKKNYYFNRANRLDFTIKSKTISPQYFKKFEDKSIYLILENNPEAELFSDYYQMNLEFCANPAPSDNIQLCVIKLTPGY